MDTFSVKAEDLLISQENLEKLKNSEELVALLSQGKSLQEILGFKDEALLVFYEAAKEIHSQQRFKEAAKAFIFLTSLAPRVPAFWIGLGLAQQEDQEMEKAADAFQTAAELNNLPM